MRSTAAPAELLHELRETVSIRYIFESKEPIPHCTCGGVIRPDITLYEEMLPDEAVETRSGPFAGD